MLLREGSRRESENSSSGKGTRQNVVGERKGDDIPKREKRWTINVSGG